MKKIIILTGALIFSISLFSCGASSSSCTSSEKYTPENIQNVDNHNSIVELETE